MSYHKHHKREPDCDYPECNQRHNIHHCKYCHKLFCREHLEAKLPGMPHFDESSPYDRVLMLEWRTPGGHACPSYYDYVEEQRKIESEKYGKALEALLNTHTIKHTTPERPPIKVIIETPRPTHTQPDSTPVKPTHPRPIPKPITPMPHQHHKPNYKKLLNRILIISGIVILICIIAFLVISIQPGKIVSHNETKQMPRTVSITSPANLSIANYTIITDENYTNSVSMLVYLKEEYTPISATSNKIARFVTDDYNNNIRLFLKMSVALRSDKLFVSNGTTTQSYRVIGVLSNSKDGLTLEASDIKKEDKPLVSQTKEIVEEQIITKNESVKGSLNIAYGLNKIRYLFGCNKDERRYNFKCISVINCSDGTLEPECSTKKPYQCIGGALIENSSVCGCPVDFTEKDNSCRSILCSDGTKEPRCSSNKPLQCVNNTLIKNAGKCGCPEDYKIKNNDCVKIQRCSDRTIYDECSSTKPLFCDNGALTDKASVCGCDWSDYADGDNCITKVRSVEKQIFHLTNEERVNNGLRTLEWDDKLSDIARAHSTDMGVNDFFEHDNLQGESPSDRARNAGYSIRKSMGGGSYMIGIGENIGMMPTGDVEGRGYVRNTPEDVSVAQVDGWMNSPGHRANILNTDYDRIGVGCYYDGLYYICTQDFW